jgi:hypothetical protein
VLVFVPDESLVESVVLLEGDGRDFRIPSGYARIRQKSKEKQGILVETYIQTRITINQKALFTDLRAVLALLLSTAAACCCVKQFTCTDQFIGALSRGIVSIFGRISTCFICTRTHQSFLGHQYRHCLRSRSLLTDSRCSAHRLTYIYRSCFYIGIWLNYSVLFLPTVP